MATPVALVLSLASASSFQSIADTKDWRPSQPPGCYARPLFSLQSIGVTKDWRLLHLPSMIKFLNWGLQSIGVTKDWRRPMAYGFARRSSSCFQSIGVTKDCGLERFVLQGGQLDMFPINRRHQGLATADRRHPAPCPQDRFPNNRRHQGLATGRRQRWRAASRGFQSIGVTKVCDYAVMVPAAIAIVLFPINGRHQGLATCP